MLLNKLDNIGVHALHSSCWPVSVVHYNVADIVSDRIVEDGYPYDKTKKPSIALVTRNFVVQLWIVMSK
jgi:hypothetical protein